MAPIRYTKRALSRLQHIGEWIAQDNPAAAERVVARIVNAITLLACHPHLGRRGRISGSREVVLSDIPYIIVYRLKSRHIEVVTVMHTSQRWPDRL